MRLARLGCTREGGIGKSTLAAKAFAESEGFQGKFWADVRAGTPLIEFAERALQELGMHPEQLVSIPKTQLPQRLVRHLQGKRYLLAIDNLESLLSSEGKWLAKEFEDFWAQLRECSSQSVVLLSSREYPPAYFSWGKSKWLLLENGLSASEGAALLKALEITGSEQERKVVSEQVQGHPLALSLIAGWLRRVNASCQQAAISPSLLKK